MTDKDRIKLREITEQVSDFTAILIEISDELKDIDETNEEVKCELNNASAYFNMIVSQLGLVCELIDTAYNKDKENERL